MDSQDKYFIGSYIEHLYGGKILFYGNERATYEMYVRKIWNQFCIDSGVGCIPNINGLTDALQRAFGYTLGIQYDPAETRVTTKNGTWYITNIKHGLLIAPFPRFKTPQYHSNLRREMNIQKTPEVIADVIREFDEFLPIIGLLVNEKSIEVEKDRKLQNLVLTTAKGLVDTLISNGQIELKSYPKVYQTFKGEFIRVDIDGSNKLSFGCRLKNLEKELLERFKKK